MFWQELERNLSSAPASFSLHPWTGRKWQKESDKPHFRIQREWASGRIWPNTRVQSTREWLSRRGWSISCWQHGARITKQFREAFNFMGSQCDNPHGEPKNGAQTQCVDRHILSDETENRAKCIPMHRSSAAPGTSNLSVGTEGCPPTGATLTVTPHPNAFIEHQLAEWHQINVFWSPGHTLCAWLAIRSSWNQGEWKLALMKIYCGIRASLLRTYWNNSLSNPPMANNFARKSSFNLKGRCSSSLWANG